MSDALLNITPVVASTCPDFERERIFLKQIVFPEIDKLCRERGRSFSPVDLMLGLNEEQLETEDIVQISLDYVTRGAPFFICLLGDRYGVHVPPIPKSQQTIEMPVMSNRRRFTLRPDDHALGGHHHNKQHRRSTLRGSMGGAAVMLHWLRKSFHRAAQSGYNWLLNEAYENSSLVEIQVLQAAYVTGFENCRFYFRSPGHVDTLYTDLSPRERAEKLAVFHPESSFAAAKLDELKQRLVRSGLEVKYYTTLDQLQEVIVQDFREYLDMQTIPDFVRDADPNRRDHEIFASSRRDIYIPSVRAIQITAQLTHFCMPDEDDGEKPALPVDPLKDFYRQDYSLKLQKAYERLKAQSRDATKSALSPNARICAVTGERGCGKSTIISNWAQGYKITHPDLLVIEHYVGCNWESTNLLKTLRWITKLIRDHFGVQAHEDLPVSSDPELNFRYVGEAFAGALSLGPVVVVIDGLDILSHHSGTTPEKVKPLSWLPAHLPDTCRLVVSTVGSDLTHYTLTARQDVRVLSIPPQARYDEDKTRMEALVDAFHQTLPHEYWVEFKSWPLRSSPLAQVILAREFHILGNGAAWEALTNKILDTQTVREFFTRVLQRWLNDYSWVKLTPVEQSEISLDKDETPIRAQWEGWVSDAMSLIALSRGGLPLDGLMRLLEALGYEKQAAVASFDWYRMYNAASSVLQFRDGRVIFTHSHFREIVEHLFLGAVIAGSVENRCQETILPTYADARFRMHQLLADYFLEQKDYPETLYHLDRASSFDKVVDMIVEPELFITLLNGTSNSSHIVGSLPNLHEFLNYWRAADRARPSLADHLVRRLKVILDLDVSIPKREIMKKEAVKKRLSIELGIDKKLPKKHKIPTLPPPPTVVIFGEKSEMNEKMEFSPEHKVTFAIENGATEDSDQPLNLWVSIEYGWKAGNLLAVLGYRDAALVVLRGIFEKLESHLLSEAWEQHVQAGIALDIVQLLDSPKQRQPWLRRALDQIGTALSLVNSSEMCDPGFSRERAQVLKGRCLLHQSDIAFQKNDVNETQRLLQMVGSSVRSCRSITLEADYHHKLALLKYHTREYAACFNSLERAIEMQQRWYGTNHPVLAELFIQMATLLSDPDWTEKYEPLRAEAYLRRALSVQEASLPSNSLIMADTMTQLGQLLMQDQRWLSLQEAHLTLVKALDIRVAKLGVEHPITQSTQLLIRDLEFIKNRTSPSQGRSVSASRPATSLGLRSTSRSSPNSRGYSPTQSRGRASTALTERTPTRGTTRESLLSPTPPPSTTAGDRRISVRFQTDTQETDKGDEEDRGTAIFVPLPKGSSLSLRHSSRTQRLLTRSRSASQMSDFHSFFLKNTLSGPMSSLESLTSRDPKLIRKSHVTEVHYKSAYYTRASPDIGRSHGSRQDFREKMDRFMSDMGGSPSPMQAAR